MDRSKSIFESFSPLLLLALLLSHFGCSQKPAQEQAKPNLNLPVPAWVKECSAFPDKWYCGSGSSNAEAIGEMVNQIFVSVTSEYSQEIERNLIRQVEAESKKTEIINQKDVQKVEASSSNIEVSGTRFYQHPNGTFYAAVKREDLADFYRLKMSSLFSFAEKELAVVELQAEQCQNKAALNTIHVIEDSLRNASSLGFLLRVVGSDSSYMIKEKDFFQMASIMKMQLQSAISVYLDVSKSDYSDLDKRLYAQMQENGCNCAIAKKENADYLVTINAKLNNCNETGSGPVFCYANATVEVNNLRCKKTVSVKIPEAKGAWMKGNKEKATEEAFKKLTNSLAEKIIQTINQ